MHQFIDTVWHRYLRRPYKLHVSVDQGSGIPIVLLHGIGRSGEVWRPLVGQLAHKPYRVLAYDLLGFGTSPKPNWVGYDVDDHARAVIRSIEASRIRSPVLLVGHSMGCLISVRIARLRPDLVRHLVLYEMPLYEGLPERRAYRLRLKLYQSIYNRVIAYQPNFTVEKRRLLERAIIRMGFPPPDPSTWVAFTRSLDHTIVHQTTAQDIKQLRMPMDVIYGSRDMLVIRGKVQQIFGKDAINITAHTVKAGHIISVAASAFIAVRIDEALTRHTAVATPARTSKKV
jgi:pimeloyl-ACP methyl ester carboxylesterase